MDVGENLLRVIANIYEAAFEPASWSDTLLQITDLVGGNQVMMGVHDFGKGSVSVLAPRMDPDHLRSYAENWGRGDILWERTNGAPIGEVLVAERFVPRSELLRTDIYREWYRSVDIGAAGLGINLPSQNGIPAVCGIKRPRGDDAFTSEQIDIFRTLAPHLVRAARMQRSLWELQLKDALLRAGIGSRRPFLLVDPLARVLFASENAARLLGPPGPLGVKGGAVVATDADASRELQRLVANSADLDVLPDANSGIMAHGATRSIHIEVLPFPTRRSCYEGLWDGAVWPAAVLILTDAEAQYRAHRSLLQDRFGLTSAEAEVTLQIVNGDGRRAAAGRLNISPGTLRIHLQHVFEKLHVQRQAQLVKLVCNTLSRAGHRSSTEATSKPANR